MREGDVSSFERASKRFYAIASDPSNPIHTPLRLTCRDLALNLDTQIEKVKDSVIQCSLTQQETRQVRIPSLRLRYASDVKSLEATLLVSKNLNHLFQSFKQYLAQSNTEGKTKEFGINAFAITKLIKGSLKSSAITKFKAEKAAESFQEKVFNDLIDSYAKQSPDTITKESYGDKIDQIKSLFNNVNPRDIETRLKDALVKENGKGILNKIK